MEPNGPSILKSWTRRAARVAGAGTLAALLVTVLSSPAGADSASDPRATFFTGNVTTCAAIGLAADTQLGSDTAGNASDASVSGVVKTNAGSIQPGQGQELDVSTANANVVPDAIVVKGGDGYNVYSDPSVVPPALPPDQHYISPLNNGGNVPAISHWFVCYRVEQPALSITKTADAASVPAGSPIGFTVSVSNSGASGTGTALGVTVTDPLPAGSGVSWTIDPAYTGPGSCSITGTAGSETLSCSLGDLAAGAGASVHVKSATTLASAGTYPNTASASATNAPTTQASATTTVLTVVRLFLGYADGLRTAPQHTPGTPWEGSPATHFVGCPNDVCSNGKAIYDGGAILVKNFSSKPLTLGSAKVVIGHCTFTPWGTNLVIPAASGSAPGSIVLTQTVGTAPQGHQAGCVGHSTPTKGDNFDTSDTYPTSCTSTKNDGLVPAITLTVAGVTKTWSDTAQILATHGIDSGCTGGNETIPWKLLGSWTLPH